MILRRVFNWSFVRSSRSFLGYNRSMTSFSCRTRPVIDHTHTASFSMFPETPADFSQSAAAGDDIACVRAIDQDSLQQAVFIIFQTTQHLPGENDGLKEDHVWIVRHWRTLVKSRITTRHIPNGIAKHAAEGLHQRVSKGTGGRSNRGRALETLAGRSIWQNFGNFKAWDGCNWTIILLSVIIGTFWHPWAVIIRRNCPKAEYCREPGQFWGSWFARIESIRAIVRKTKTDTKCGVEAA